MGVVEDRQPVRIERVGELQCLFEALEGLVGESVDEVGVDTVDPIAACQVDGGFCQLVGLDTVDLLLDFGVEILHAKADTVKSMFLENLHLLFIEKSWVYFTADLCVATPVGEL